MSAFIVPSAALLAMLFAASAIGKLRSANHGRSTFAALQLPVRHPDALASALIAVELLVAVGLIVTTGWIFVGFTAVALALTAGLLFVVVRAHRLGANGDCGCFGDWFPAPIGPRLITRNIVLVVAATALTIAASISQGLAGASTGVPDSFSSRSGAVIALSGLLAAALTAAAVWAIGRAPDASANPSVPRGGGAVVLPDTSEIVDLLAPGARARLLLFVSPGCHACESALASLRDAQEPLSDLLDIYVIQHASAGPAHAWPAHNLPSGTRFGFDVGGSLGAILGIGPGTPVAALIGADGSQAGPLAIGSEEAALLVHTIRSVAEGTFDLDREKRGVRRVDG